MNKKDQKIIKDSEERDIPIFVLTAKDALSVDLLSAYRWSCETAGCSPEHLKGIDDRIDEFTEWQHNHLGEIKLPD